MSWSEIVIVLAVLMFMTALLKTINKTAAKGSRGIAVVLAAVFGIACLLLIGLIGTAAIFWFQTRSVVRSRVTGIACGPPAAISGEVVRVPDPPDAPVPPAPPSTDGKTPEAPSPSGSDTQTEGGDATDRAASSQSAAPIRSPTPIQTVQNPAAPPWVDGRAERVDGEYHFPIRVGPYTTPLECEQGLLAAVNQAVDEYVALYLGEAARGRVRLPRAFIEERLIRERWYENRPILVTNTEQADMTVLHALLVFDSSTNDYLKSLWRSLLSLYRVGIFVAGFAGVLWLLTVAWSYLKLDQLSAGRYRGRLRAAAVIAVILPPLLLALLLGFGEMPALSFAAGV